MAKNEKFSAAPYAEIGSGITKLKRRTGLPVDSVGVRNRRKFGVAATCAGRDINDRKPHVERCDVTTMTS